MACRMRDNNHPLTLSLAGTLTLRDSTERLLLIKGSGCRAILATLSTAPGMKRSRDWLRSTLWSGSDEQKSSASLRTALSSLRRQLGPGQTVVMSNNTHVWLENVEYVEQTQNANVTFFEDAPSTLGEPFEDWLRAERAAWESRNGGRSLTTGDVAPLQDQSIAHRPCLVVMPPHFVTEEKIAEVIAEFALQQIIDNLRLQNMIDVFDLRDLDSDQLETFDARMPSMDGLLRFRVSTFERQLHIGIHCLKPISRRVVWSAALTTDRESSFALSTDQIAEFANQAGESIQRALLQRMADKSDSHRREGVNLFAAVHQIMSMSHAGQDTARRMLKCDGLVERSPAAAAWYCMSFANSVGEADPRILPEMFEELEEQTQRTLAMDPCNALTLSIISHIEGFIFRRLDKAAEFAQQARRLAPFFPLAWDLSAMNAVYRGDGETAFRMAREAQRLGRFSPYKTLFDSSLCISASVTGRHDLAIRTGEEILKKQSSFLAVMRHMSASLAEVGCIEDAREMIRRVQESDPSFLPDTVLGPSYPLPSPESRDHVRRGFELVGLQSG